MKYIIKGGTIVTPDYSLGNDASLTIENGIIVKMGKPDSDADFEIVLNDNDLVFPGLINGHDHLLGNYYPRVGSGPYMNWKPWDNDLKMADVYKERGNIANFDLYLLACYRNIISGVTTVSDHIPHTVNQDYIDNLPIRVLKDYRLEHEMSSFDLRWGRSATVEHKEAVKNNIPFITHIAEGYDEESTLGIDIMRELDILDEYSVLIHGIMFSKEDIKHIAEKNANVVWCPASNQFMFNDTTDIKELLKQQVNVSLGTDSPMSGGMNILEEIKYAYTLYKNIYKEELEYKTLALMITSNPAKAFRQKNIGELHEGGIADILILKDMDKDNPYKSLVNAWYNDIKMVIHNGLPIYGYASDYDIFENFREYKKSYQVVTINGKDRILIGKPIELYERIWDDVKFKKILPFFPVDFPNNRLTI